MQLKEVVAHLDALAPLHLAESWDNVGLLLGVPSATTASVLFCIDATPAVLAEAKASATDLLVAYHPPIFRPVDRLAPDSPLFVAAQNNLALYSPHTALDAAIGGTNDVLAAAAGLDAWLPLVPAPQPAPAAVGQGRVGSLAGGAAVGLQALGRRLRDAMGLSHVCMAPAVAADPADATIRTVAVAAGAGDALWPAAQAAGADVLVTGELRHHTVLAALAAGVSIIALGHDGSERAALRPLMQRLQGRAAHLRLRQSIADTSPWSPVV